MKSLIYKEIKKYWKYLLIYFVFGIVLNIANVITNIINQQIMDNVFYNNNLFLFFNKYLYQYIMLLAIILYHNLSYSYINTYVTSNIDCNIKLIFHRIFLHYPEEFFYQKSCMDIYYRIFNDLKTVYVYWINFFMTIPLSIFYVICIFVIMFSWSTLLSVLYIVFMLINLMIINFTQKKLYEISNQQKENEQHMMNSFTGDFNKITSIKSLGIEEYILKSRKQEFINLKNYNIKSNFLMMVFGVFADFGTYIWNILLVSIGAVLVCNSKMIIGEYVTFSTLTIMSNVKIKEIFNIIYSYPVIKASYTRINSYLSDKTCMKNEIETINTNHDIITSKDNITIQVLDLDYNYLDKKIFENESYVFQSPSIINVVGNNGSGKTTFLKILDRLLLPKKGSININNINYENISNKAFRESVFYLEQSSKVFNMTLRENIIFSNDKSLDEIIMYYFNQLGLNMDNFEKGLDTKIENDGATLSIGTIQKIAITRLFLRKPKIILLDEPTASLDEQTRDKFTLLIEKYIKENNAICFNVTHDNKINKGVNLLIGEKNHESKNNT